jgi:hypothetical protein
MITSQALGNLHNDSMIGCMQILSFSLSHAGRQFGVWSIGKVT